MDVRNLLDSAAEDRSARGAPAIRRSRKGAACGPDALGRQAMVGDEVEELTIEP